MQCEFNIKLIRLENWACAKTHEGFSIYTFYGIKLQANGWYTDPCVFVSKLA